MSLVVSNFSNESYSLLTMENSKNYVLVFYELNRLAWNFQKLKLRLIVLRDVVILKNTCFGEL